MTLAASGPVPPGWYPDPGGARQWRVWTGVRWSEVTRPYGDPPAPRALAGSLDTVAALQRVTRYGVVAVLAGVALAVSVAAHLPGTAHPVSRVLAVTLLDAAAALVILGSIAYAAAGRALAGGWRLWTIVPGLNAAIVSSLVARRLDDPRSGRRLVMNVAAIGLFALRFRFDPFLGVLPALVAADLMIGAQRLLTQLVGPTPPEARAS